MENTDSETLRRALIPPKNYDQLSLSELLLELYKENQALDKFDHAIRYEKPNSAASSGMSAPVSNPNAQAVGASKSGTHPA